MLLRVRDERCRYIERAKKKNKVYDHDSTRGLATVVVVQYDAKGHDNLNNKKRKKQF